MRTAMGTERTRKESPQRLPIQRESPRRRFPEAAFANVPIDGAEAEQKEPSHDKLNKDHAFVITQAGRVHPVGNLDQHDKGTVEHLDIGGVC